MQCADRPESAGGSEDAWPGDVAVPAGAGRLEGRAETSNSYVLALAGVGTLPTCTGGQSGRQTLKEFFISTPEPDLTRKEALKGLAAIATGRMRKLGLA